MCFLQLAFFRPITRPFSPPRPSDRQVGAHQRGLTISCTNRSARSELWSRTRARLSTSDEHKLAKWRTPAGLVEHGRTPQGAWRSTECGTVPLRVEFFHGEAGDAEQRRNRDRTRLPYDAKRGSFPGWSFGSSILKGKPTPVGIPHPLECMSYLRNTHSRYVRTDEPSWRSLQRTSPLRVMGRGIMTTRP